MRYLVIPAALLAGIVAFSLWCGTYVEDRAETWSAALEEADNAAWQEDWQAADGALRQAYADWETSQDFLHTILSHDELEQAESLFVGAFAVCREADGPDFHTLLAQLRAALDHLREAQEISVANVF